MICEVYPLNTCSIFNARIPCFREKFVASHFHPHHMFLSIGTLMPQLLVWGRCGCSCVWLNSIGEILAGYFAGIHWCDCPCKAQRLTNRLSVSFPAGLLYHCVSRIIHTNQFYIAPPERLHLPSELYSIQNHGNYRYQPERVAASESGGALPSGDCVRLEVLWPSPASMPFSISGSPSRF